MNWHPANRAPRVWRVDRAIDPITLSLFRCAFGIVLCGDALRCALQAERLFPAWEFRPPPLPLVWLDHLPAVPAMPCLFVAAAAAASVAIGYRTQVAGAVLTAMYALVFLWDPTQFNNHHYLIVLLAGWIAILGLNRELSVDGWRNSRVRCRPTLWWHLGIFQFHIALVYGFGTFNKLNSDWLRGEPLALWLAVEQHRPLVGPWLAHPYAKYCFAYGGLIFDAVIVPLLCWRKTRSVALVLTAAFHLTNSVLFRIGPFPWLMLATNVLFLDRGMVRAALQRWLGSFATQPDLTDAAASPMRPHVVVALRWYLAMHLLWPFRVFWLSDQPEWTEEGKNYSWRMMLSHKDTFVGIMVVDLYDGRVWEVDQRAYLSRRQLRGKGVWGNPRHLAAFARMLRREALRQGFRDPFVKVDAVASLNGRPYQYLVDPKVDLSLAEQPFWSVPEWVVPLKPGQPIGDYSFLDPQVKQQRVMRVIQDHAASIDRQHPIGSATERVARRNAS